MKVDLMSYVSAISEAREAAPRAEADGYDGWFAPETQADAFLACALGAEHTERVEIGTAIAVAFARSPMTLALQANDLQAASGGRFVLGVGSQIKPHIERRYSMPWSKPAKRMREYILAVRAIWDTWATDAPLAFEGEFYTHNLMTPFFNPGPNPHGNPKVLLAAVGPLMTEMAGEVADGILCHGFSTEKYVREATLPALERGAAKAGRSLDGFEITAPGFIVAADTEEERAAGIQMVRGQIGFYGSTPAYRPVLEMHGRGELQDELRELTKRDRWGELASLVDDELLDLFAIVGTPEEAVAEIRRRYGDLATRVTLHLPAGIDPDRRAALFAELRGPA
ncbi:MAG: TIGR03617 family F420-dependent LLM class oxidoreductase [Solirubrobacteraceae bacterium]|nr:TIGR03617 family F420-dependent LLM class oxidoreductase [Solirubrobacteraceae bacterium]